MYCYGPGHGVLLCFFVGQELASFFWVSSNMAGWEIPNSLAEK
jgi:hypothetical protein